MRRIAAYTAGLLAGAMALGDAASAQTTLRASHQFPQGDVRDEMVRIIADEVEKADVGLEIRVYPGASLYKPNDQWNALTSGQLDLSSFPLDYASGQQPAFSATLMPGLVRSHERATKLNDSPFMESIKEIIEEAGAVVLSDAWLAGAFASTENCILNPDDIEGQVMRAAGPAFEQMLAAAGASISSMPSSEIYTGLQTGVLDAANTSTASFVSYRLYEQVTCLTAPGENALWFMYEPILMSKQVYDGLDEEQQQALMAAGEKAEAFFADAAKGLDDDLVKTFEEAGVEVVQMDEAQFDAWLELAKESAYPAFAEKVANGQELIDQALAVE
jgi:TRAP-type C4-dicarboxylate transport system substrate-binding protein